MWFKCDTDFLKRLWPNKPPVQRQRLCWLTLLAWQEQGIEKNFEYLSWLTGFGEDVMEQVWPEFESVSENRGGKWMLLEMWEAKDAYEKKADTASESAQRRWAKARENRGNNANVMQTQCEPNANALPTHSERNACGNADLDINNNNSASAKGKQPLEQSEPFNADLTPKQAARQFQREASKGNVPQLAPVPPAGNEKQSAYDFQTLLDYTREANPKKTDAEVLNLTRWALRTAGNDARVKEWLALRKQNQQPSKPKECPQCWGNKVYTIRDEQNKAKVKDCEVCGATGRIAA